MVSSNQLMLVAKITLVSLMVAWPISSNSGSLASSPLFLGGSVKPNVMLAIDDSGSMDNETMLPGTVDGALFWSNSLESFVNNDGTLVEGNGSDYSNYYSYLFPNGANSSYNGSRLYGDSDKSFAIPPVAAYGFARSPSWNAGYYDSTVTYNPWPTYDATTWSFSDVDPEKAPWDPVFNPTTFNVDLTQNISSSTTNWEFYAVSSKLICADDGTTCGSTGGHNISYYPATFYYPDKTSVYTYLSTSGSGSSGTTPSYCSSRSGNANYEWIDQVKVGTFTNSSSGNRYTDFTSQVISLSVGTTTIELSPGFSGQAYNERWNVWIDFNQDGDFTGTGELVFSTNAASKTAVSGTITIPSTAKAGKTRMRVSMQWKNNPAACGDFDYGEVEDYTVEITNPSTTPTPTGETRNCSSGGTAEHYREFVADPGKFSGVDAIAPDGSCLKKYEIKPSTTSYPSGRSYAEEMQNFANWFTYFRRRHHAIRGGVAHALDGVSGLRAGLFWFNNRRTVSMFDMDTDQQAFLDDHYRHVNTGGTPTRQSLDHAGTQFMRTDGNAPITEVCQKNFTLLFTDGFANDTSYSSVGNDDSGAGSPFADSYSDTAGDIAHYYYEKNLRSDMQAGEVDVVSACLQSNPPAYLDCNPNLHMTTFSVGLGVSGTIFGQTHTTVKDAHDAPPTWPDVSASSTQVQVDDLYHAAVNGRGEIFNATTPAALTSELTAVFDTIAGQIGGASGASFNSSRLSTNNAIFAATFNSGGWTGELNAIRLDGTTGELLNSAWEASEKLDQMTPSQRVIITNNGSDGIPFQWSNVNSVSFIRDDLNTDPSGATDTKGESRLEYLRGDTSKEGTEFRSRASLLGDIVHSTPMYVGEPEQSWPDILPFGDNTVANYYSTFKVAQKNRQEMVYVGANDGMLHGFDGSLGTNGGRELLAYIPSMVYSSNKEEGLHYLTDPDYRHRYYVDLSPTVSDVFIKNKPASSAPRAWRTMLVGGMRNGGRGLFGLDVTDPNNFSEAKAEELVLWEFDQADDSDLGDITTKPVIGMMNNGKWAVIFGNGYNSSSSRLFILFIEDGLDGTWGSGDYIELDTGVSGGMSQPTVADLDGDKVIDRIYAGDLSGNMWVFDVSNSNTNKWESAKKQGSTPVPLFTAKRSDGTLQPITTNPLLARNPLSNTDNSNTPNVMVYFGTGRYLSNGDPSDTQVQSFYGVWDAKTTSKLERSDLTEHKVVKSGNNRQVTGTEPSYPSVSGFYMDFPADGERIVDSPKTRGGILFFNTMKPESDPCDQGGSGWLMSVDLGSGLTPSRPVFDSNNDGQVDDDDTAYAGQFISGGLPAVSGFLGDNQYTPTSAGTVERRAIDTGEADRTGRLSWDEIISND